MLVFGLKSGPQGRFYFLPLPSLDCSRLVGYKLQFVLQNMLLDYGRF